MGASLVLIGVVIGVIGVFAIAARNQPSPEELEAIRLQDTVDYIKIEQERLGVNCNELSMTMRDFLEKDIKPVLIAHQFSQNWYEDIDSDVRNRMGVLRDNYFACGRLYRAAQHGKWDGLNGVEFTVELDRDVIVLNTLIRFEFCDVHDAKCLDQGFRDLHDAVSKIETRLALADTKR